MASNSSNVDSSGVIIVRLTPYLKQRIMQLYSSGINQIEIMNRLCYEENVKVSRINVHKTIKEVNDQNPSVPPIKRGREPVLDANHLDYISLCLDEIPELSANELCIKLKSVFDVTVSATTVKMARQRLGWVSSTQAYCQTVKAANRPKRLEYAIRCIETREQFNDVIFTDESTTRYKQVLVNASS